MDRKHTDISCQRWESQCSFNIFLLFSNFQNLGCVFCSLCTYYCTKACTKSDWIKMNKNAFQYDAYRPLQWPSLEGKCVSSQGGLPRGVCPGGGCLGVSATPPMDRQTPVKILLCPKLRLRAVNTKFLFAKCIVENVSCFSSLSNWPSLYLTWMLSIFMVIAVGVYWGLMTFVAAIFDIAVWMNL